jgi:hypothetical protein
MPDIDGGHGFLTALLPLNVEPCRRIDGTTTSPAHAVRELLARLPTAQHSPACLANGAQSPFARSSVTHFARFAVIDTPAFNGHARRDAIRASLPGGADPLAEPQIDQFCRPYLLFCADFDVVQSQAQRPELSVRTYLESLWMEAPEPWPALLDHCDAATDITDATRFADYVQRRSVETTMPFNDYNVAPAASRKTGASILQPIAIGVAAGLGTFALFHILLPRSGWLLAMLCAIVVLAVVADVAIVRKGSVSTPWSAGTDLATVLKALYLQAAFARFAVAHQGVAPDILLSDFRGFLAAMRPSDLAGPTQAPGVVPQ